MKGNEQDLTLFSPSDMDSQTNKQAAKPSSILRTVIMTVIVMLLLGFLVDLFSGFSLLRQSKSIYAGLAGLLIVAIFYMMGEAGSEWIGGNDKVADPLYKRALRVLALLIFAVLILTILWFVLKYIGLMRT